MDTNKDRLTLTVPEVAALLRISRGACYEAVRTGVLPGVLRFGRVIRLSRYAIEQMLAGQEVNIDSKQPNFQEGECHRT